MPTDTVAACVQMSGGVSTLLDMSDIPVCVYFPGKGFSLSKKKMVNCRVMGFPPILYLDFNKR